MRQIVLPLLAAVTLAACARTPAETARAQQGMAAEQAGLEKELAGLVPGEHPTCLNNLAHYSLKAYGPTLIYRVSDRLKYRNDTAGGCENVARGDILVTVSNEGRVCQGDIARTVEPGSRIPTGNCGLRTFTKYTRP